MASAPAPLIDVVERRVAELAGYQNTAYARHYLDQVLETARIEAERTGDPAFPVTLAFARGLHKLMAYKDEYEVARLHLDPVERAAITAEFGPGASTKVLLHPPVLKSLGLTHKIKLGPAAGPAFRVLRAGRHLRGTALDPFGRTEMRRTERALVGEYRALVAAALEQLHPASADTVTALAALPEEIRGYDDVKRVTIDRFRVRAAELVDRLGEGAGTFDSSRRHPLAG
jgi:indolepyruvate ferredoxin oxidoreductase